MALQYTGINDCNRNSTSKGQKGCTYYANTSNPYLNPSGQSNSSCTISWTGTQPRCYVQGKQVCNLSFDLAISSNTANNDAEIDCVMNGSDTIQLWHSRIYGHDVTEIIDVSQYNSYNDSGANTLVFTNKSNVGMWVSNLRIMREYGMCYLPCDANNTCASGGMCGTNQCSPGTTYAANGSLDGGRNDTPCNYESSHCMSMDSFGTASAGSIVAFGSPLTWTFQNPGYDSGETANYNGPAICFFNLNNVNIASTSADNDVRFQFNLNGNSIATMYNSRVPGHSTYAGIDLVKFPQYYNDAPSAINTVKLSNYDSSTTIKLTDQGGINVYRVYNVTSP